MTLSHSASWSLSPQSRDRGPQRCLPSTFDPIGAPGVYHRARIYATLGDYVLRTALSDARLRMELQESCGGGFGAPRDLAGARPVDGTKQQAHHQIAPQ